MARNSVVVSTCPQMQMPTTILDNAADNECAEALLQLAMSIVPVPLQGNSSSSPGSQTKSAASISPGHGYSRSPAYESGFTEEQRAEMECDLLERIQQDHSYCSSGDDKARPVDFPVAYYSGTTSDSFLEEILGDDVGVPPRWNKENTRDSPQKPTNKRNAGRRTRPYYGSCPRKNYANVTGAKAKQLTVSPPAPSTTSAANDREKYNNFQLLMKCLIANDPADSKLPLDDLESATSLQEAGVNNNQVDSSSKPKNGRAKLNSDDEGEHDVESDLDGDSQYECPGCTKTFSKRRYLTKHVRRMHPETEMPEVKDEVATACPNCFRVIQRRNFRRHLMVCDVEMNRAKNRRTNDSDLDFCQFCGAQMKRHLLVKHLAKDHCIDRHTIQFDQEFSKFLADEENASMYPSDTSYPMQETSASAVQAVETERTDEKPMDVTALIVPCPKCNVSISDDLLARHMALDHEIIIDNASALAASKCSCKHSMLQAYLDGSTETKNSAGGSYPCQACVQSLSTLSEHCSATVSARSSERIALSSPLSGMSSTSPVKSTPGTGSTISAEETRMQVSLLEDTAHTLLKCAATPVSNLKH